MSGRPKDHYRYSQLSKLGAVVPAIYDRRFKDCGSTDEPYKEEQYISRWNRNCNTAFLALKDASFSAIIRFPVWTLPFRYHTNANPLAIGETLTRFDKKGDKQDFSFFSRRLSAAKENFSGNDRELIG